MPCSTALGVAYATCIYHIGTGITTTGVGSNRFIRRMYTTNRNEGKTTISNKKENTMKVKVNDWSTTVTPDEQDVIKECRPHNGADTCVYLFINEVENVERGAKPYLCYYNNGMSLSRIKEWNKQQETGAKRLGCGKVIAWHKAEPDNIAGKQNQTFDIS